MTPSRYARRTCTTTATLLLALLPLSLCAQSPTDAQEEPKVRIEGGHDGTGQNYTWRVINIDAPPIMEIEIPQYRGDVFIAPEGWDDECSHLLGTDHGDRSMRYNHYCIARAPSERDAIKPGGSQVVQMRVSPKGAFEGTGEVTIRFADGSETKIPNVPLPRPEPRAAKYTRLIGFVAFGLIFVAIQTVRGRGKRRAAAQAAGAFHPAGAGGSANSANPGDST